MKLLLTSAFSNVGKHYLKDLIGSAQGKTCLFVGYACENDEEMLEGSSRRTLEGMGVNLINLLPYYDFSDKIDMVFVRGGNVTKLIHYLKEFGQFEKIRDLIENQGATYIGVSAGSVLAGNDTEWTLRSEPYPVDLKSLYGKDALKGFGWVNKMVFVHSSIYRFPYEGEVPSGKENYRLADRKGYRSIVQDKRNYPPKSYISIGNNEVYEVDGDKCTLCTEKWENYPIYEA